MHQHEQLEIIYAYVLGTILLWNSMLMNTRTDFYILSIFKISNMFFFIFLGPTGKTLSTKWFKIPGRWLNEIKYSKLNVQSKTNYYQLCNIVQSLVYLIVLDLPLLITPLVPYMLSFGAIYLDCVLRKMP